MLYFPHWIFWQESIHTVAKKAGKCCLQSVCSFGLWTAGNMCQLSLLNVYITVSGQLNMLEEGLINHPAVGFGESGRKASDLQILLAKIEESEVCVLLVRMIHCSVLILPSPLSQSVYLLFGPSWFDCWKWELVVMSFIWEEKWEPFIDYTLGNKKVKYGVPSKKISLCL